jgi:hypothetical protein
MDEVFKRHPQAPPGRCLEPRRAGPCQQAFRELGDLIAGQDLRKQNLQLISAVCPLRSHERAYAVQAVLVRQSFHDAPGQQQACLARGDQREFLGHGCRERGRRTFRDIRRDVLPCGLRCRDTGLGDRAARRSFLHLSGNGREARDSLHIAQCRGERARDGVRHPLARLSAPEVPQDFPPRSGERPRDPVVIRHATHLRHYNVNRTTVHEQLWMSNSNLRSAELRASLVLAWSVFRPR